MNFELIVYKVNFLEFFESENSIELIDCLVKLLQILSLQKEDRIDSLYNKIK